MILFNKTSIVATILLASFSCATILCSAAEFSSPSSNFLRGKTRQLSTCKMYKGPTPCFDIRSWCARLGSQYVTCATITSQQCTLFHRSTHPCPEKCGLIPVPCSNFQQSTNQAPTRNRLPLRRPVLPQGSSNFPNEPVNNNNGNNSGNNSSNSDNNSNNTSNNSNSLATRAPTGTPITTANNSNNSDDSNNSSSSNNGSSSNNSSSNNSNSTPAPTPSPTQSSISNNNSSNSANNNAPSFAPSPSPSTPQPTICQDEPESTKFGYRLDGGSERNNKSCGTVAAKNWRRKCQEIATLKKSGEQLLISQLCPRTCRTCPDQCEAGYISCAPTNAPTTSSPSTTPTLSGKPGGNTQSSPSNLPTLAPSASAYPTVSKGPTAVSNDMEI